MVDEILLQDALLHLCIFAETVCWPKLFNAAIDAYMLGELNLRRDILLEHVDLIYTRTHPDSTLRAFVMDSIRRLTSPESYKTYMELAQQHEDFLENLLKAVSLGLAKNDKPSNFADRKKSKWSRCMPFLARPSRQFPHIMHFSSSCTLPKTGNRYFSRSEIFSKKQLLTPHFSRLFHVRGALRTSK
jgi:hypothetical protein